MWVKDAARRTLATQLAGRGRPVGRAVRGTAPEDSRFGADESV